MASNKEGSPWKSSDLCIPIYLNQQIVFDLLSTLQGGLSGVRDIKTTTVEAQSKETRLGGSIKAGFLNLVGVDFGGERDTTAGSGSQQEMSEQKVYTPASLFAQLRKNLTDNGLLYQVGKVEEFDKLSINQFVEFKALLSKNPIVTTIEWLANALELSYAFPSVNGSIGQKQRHQLEKQQRDKQEREKKQLAAMLEAVTQAGSIEIIGKILGVEHARAVLSAQTAYFNDQNASEIEDGEYFVLGKTVKILKSTADDKESINLLRKTTLGPLDKSNFESIAYSITSGELSEFELPPFEKEIHRPAIRLVPIAIFT